MKDSYNQVKVLLDEVGPFFIRAGISENRCKMPEGDIEIIKPQKFIDAFDWLSEVIQSPEYQAVQKVWALVTPQQWAGYDLHGITGLTQQNMLADALVPFKELWKNRPGSFFGKKFNAQVEEIDENSDHNSSEQPEVQSE